MAILQFQCSAGDFGESGADAGIRPVEKRLFAGLFCGSKLTAERRQPRCILPPQRNGFGQSVVRWIVSSVPREIRRVMAKVPGTVYLDPDLIE
jgi:hypothetical protein